MSKTRLELKVGLFVFVGLLLLGLLLLQFSKGLSVFRGTYELKLKAANVGGLKARSSVLMSGVPVGVVTDIKLHPSGTNVTIFLDIFDDYIIYEDARFRIEQSGFLGDQYVAIVPTHNHGRKLQGGDEVWCEDPFNLQEVARSAGGFVKRVDETTKKLNDAVTDIRRLVLNEETLTNLAVTVHNMRLMSERALSTVGNLDSVIQTNGPALGLAVSNMVFFSDQLNHLAGSLSNTLAANSEEFTLAVRNVGTSTETLKRIVDDVNAGKGLAGTVLRNEALASNVELIAQNLSITTSNLNRLGLWGILWSRKPAKQPEAPDDKLAAPREKSN